MIPSIFKFNKKNNKISKYDFWYSILFVVFVKCCLLAILWKVCFSNPMIHNLDSNKLASHLLY